MVDALINVALLPAFSVSAVVPTVRFPPILRFDPAAVDNTGLFTPPNANPPLKLTVPAPVMESVPELSVNALFRVIVPVVRLITSVDALAFDAYVTDPITLNDPVVTAICATRVDTVVLPPIATSPFTTPKPAPMLQDVVTPEVGWLIVTFPFTVSVTAAACARELAAELAANVNEVQDVFVFIV
jgi:hypothetical protein